MMPNAAAIVRTALAGSGVDLVASCDVATYDARAPDGYRSATFLPGARSLVVAGSAGPALWRAFRAYANADRARWDEPHPLDAFVARILARADEALAGAGVCFRRFEPTVDATPRVDFVAMGHLVGLGSPGPFGMLIHPLHGAWWALRGAWLVDAGADGPLDDRPPCTGCSAPCVGGRDAAGGIDGATVEIRSRCLIGQSSRYDADQIAYHYDRAATVARLRIG